MYKITIENPVTREIFERSFDHGERYVGDGKSWEINSYMDAYAALLDITGLSVNHNYIVSAEWIG